MLRFEVQSKETQYCSKDEDSWQFPLWIVIKILLPSTVHRPHHSCVWDWDAWCISFKQLFLFLFIICVFIKWVLWKLQFHWSFKLLLETRGSYRNILGKALRQCFASILNTLLSHASRVFITFLPENLPLQTPDDLRFNWAINNVWETDPVASNTRIRKGAKKKKRNGFFFFLSHVTFLIKHKNEEHIVKGIRPHIHSRIIIKKLKILGNTILIKMRKRPKDKHRTSFARKFVLQGVKINSQESKDIARDLQSEEIKSIFHGQQRESCKKALTTTCHYRLDQCCSLQPKKNS